MPLFLEPDQRFPIALDSDKDKSADLRPTFYARAQSMRGQQELSATLDLLGTTERTDDLFKRTLDELSRCLTGWENMGGYEFNREGLEQVLSYGEARELLRKVMSNQHVKPEEKKS